MYVCPKTLQHFDHKKKRTAVHQISPTVQLISNITSKHKQYAVNQG